MEKVTQINYMLPKLRLKLNLKMALKTQNSLIQPIKKSQGQKPLSLFVEVDPKHKKNHQGHKVAAEEDKRTNN